MTTRQIRWAFFGWLFALTLIVAAFATYFTVNQRTKPSPFVPPAIWSDVYTGGEPRLKFDI